MSNLNVTDRYVDHDMLVQHLLKTIPPLDETTVFTTPREWRNYFQHKRTVGYLVGDKTGKTSFIAREMQYWPSALAIVGNLKNKIRLIRKAPEIAPRVYTANEIRTLVREVGVMPSTLPGLRVYVDNGSQVMRDYHRAIYDYLGAVQERTTRIILVG